MKYLDADTIADIKNARGCGVPWSKLAGHYHVSEDELKHACGDPVRPAATKSDDTSFDLFRTEELDGVL